MAAPLNQYLWLSTPFLQIPDFLSFPSQIAIEIDHPHLGTGEALGSNEILMERTRLEGLLPWARITTYF